ncbi:ABC transporter permease [Rubidibacter lacunae]|uniref:ABC transporter permease n=1 Tax=Rubidibacter lacunae TaxID=582514 RepID=UPI000410F51B
MSTPLAPVLRYLRVLRLFWSSSIAAELEYPLNFAIAALSSVVGLAGSIFGLFLFYRTGYNFENWRWEEALLVMSAFTLMQGISATLLVPNLNRIFEQVQQGTLDFVLLKPIGSQFWLSARVVSPWGLPDVIFGFAIAAYAGSRLDLNWSDYLFGLLPLIFGVVSLYSLWFVLGTTCIWFTKINNATEVLRGLLEAGRFPISAYPGIYRVFFTFVVPVAFLTTVPVETVLGRSQTIWVAGAGFLAAALLCFSAKFWRFALRFYTSASS